MKMELYKEASKVKNYWRHSMRIRKVFILLFICAVIIHTSFNVEADEPTTNGDQKACSHIYVKVGELLFKVPRQEVNYISTGHNQMVPHPWCRGSEETPIEAKYLSFIRTFPSYLETTSRSEKEMIARFQISGPSQTNFNRASGYGSALKEIQLDNLSLDDLPVKDDFYIFKNEKFISKKIVSEYDKQPLTITCVATCGMSFQYKEKYTLGIGDIPRGKIFLKDWPDFINKAQTYFDEVLISE